MLGFWISAGGYPMELAGERCAGCGYIKADVKARYYEGPQHCDACHKAALHKACSSSPSE